MCFVNFNPQSWIYLFICLFISTCVILKFMVLFHLSVELPFPPAVNTAVAVSERK